MKFDDFLDNIGGFGRYQIVHTLLAYTLVLPLAFQLYTLPIISSSPDFRCKLHDQDVSFQGDNGTSDYHSLNLSREWAGESQDISQCKIYNITTSNQTSSESYVQSYKCEEWVFDKSVFKSSIMEDLGLVCDKYFLKSTTEAAFMGGGLAGNALLGWTFDAYGRKMVSLLAILSLGIFGVISAWISNPYVLIVIRLFMGMGDAVTYMGLVYLCIEVVGPSKRNMVNHCVAISYAVSACLLLTFAPFVASWRILETLASISALIVIPYYWLLDESPRWLLSVGRDEEAEIIMRKMALANGSVYPEDLILRLESEFHEKQAKWTDLFRGGKMIAMTMILCFNWFAVAFMYYGLALGLDVLHTNFFLVLAISCLAEIPGYLISWYLSDRIGRKRTYTLLVFLASFFLMGTIFPVWFGDESHKWIIVTLTMFGKCLGSGAYACVSLYTPELYPTTMRSTATAVPGFASRIGSLIAPYVSDLGIYYLSGGIGQVFHLILFGVCALIAAILNLYLSETMQTQLPDTVADVKYARRPSLDLDEAPHHASTSNLDDGDADVQFQPTGRNGHEIGGW